MCDTNRDRDIATKKIAEMSPEQVMKLLIFMAGMEAQQATEEANLYLDAQTR